MNALFKRRSISYSFSQQKMKSFAYFDAYQISALSTLDDHISQ